MSSENPELKRWTGIIERKSKSRAKVSVADYGYMPYVFYWIELGLKRRGRANFKKFAVAADEWVAEAIGADVGSIGHARKAMQRLRRDG